VPISGQKQQLRAQSKLRYHGYTKDQNQSGFASNMVSFSPRSPADSLEMGRSMTVMKLNRDDPNNTYGKNDEVSHFTGRNEKLKLYNFYQRWQDPSGKVSRQNSNK
jgi:hypothetical protein